MSFTYALLTAIGVCLAAAALEGACAGRNVKSFYATLRFPRYSAPLWLWTIIGGIYYVIFCFVIYRLLRLETNSHLRSAALTLIGFMMVINALTNYLIFRARNLYLSFVIGSLFPVFDIALFICLMLVEKVAALALIPYLLYRIYGVWWGYGLWKMNRTNAHGTAAYQIVGRERRERLSQLTWSGEGCFDARRRVNSNVMQHSHEPDSRFHGVSTSRRIAFVLCVPQSTYTCVGYSCFGLRPL